MLSVPSCEIISRSPKDIPGFQDSTPIFQPLTELVKQSPHQSVRHKPNGIKSLPESQRPRLATHSHSGNKHWNQEDLEVRVI